MAANTAPAGFSINEIAETREARECLQWFTREKQWINEMHLQLCRVPAPTFLEQERAAWFLEQVGAKGMQRGAIHVATYHANLIYNSGGGSATDLCCLIQELKARVHARFGIELEEEVQYVG